MAQSFKDRIIAAYSVFSGFLKNQSPLATAIVAGGAAGDLTVTGIKPRDAIASVMVLPAPAQTVVAGGAAGDITVTGITTSDRLVSVINLTDGADLTSEFSITAADTINNAGGTATTGDDLLVVWELPVADLSSEFSIIDNDTINNTGGSSSAGRTLLVSYMMWEER
jgi:hypothetical protein